ncbi:MAG: hypothetical protein K5675_00590 [Lachnospiraceae bacterium]|nr:hypothetical protein [Lachnospiraceae bacterium]
MVKNGKKVSDYKLRELDDCIEKALLFFYSNDDFLVNHTYLDYPSYDCTVECRQQNDKEAIKHVGERTVQFRFAMYLQLFMWKSRYLREYVLDCEYNRYNGDPKRNNNELIVPDIIIHKRGDDDNNLMVIELKSHWNHDITHDDKKIKAMTDPTGIYRYQKGLSLVFGKKIDECKFTEYFCGQKTKYYDWGLWKKMCLN